MMQMKRSKRKDIGKTLKATDGRRYRVTQILACERTARGCRCLVHTEGWKEFVGRSATLMPEDKFRHCRSKFFNRTPATDAAVTAPAVTVPTVTVPAVMMPEELKPVKEVEEMSIEKPRTRIEKQFDVSANAAEIVRIVEDECKGLKWIPIATKLAARWPEAGSNEHTWQERYRRACIIRRGVDSEVVARAEWLDRKLHEQRITQKDLAKIINVSHSALTYYRQGVYAWPTKVWRDIQALFATPATPAAEVKKPQPVEKPQPAEKPQNAASSREKQALELLRGVHERHEELTNAEWRAIIGLVLEYSDNGADSAFTKALALMLEG